MDDSRMKPLLAEFGGWPIINSTWSEEGFSLEDTIVKLNSYGIHALLGVIPFFDLTNSTNHVLAVGELKIRYKKKNYVFIRQIGIIRYIGVSKRPIRL